MSDFALDFGLGLDTNLNFGINDTLSFFKKELQKSIIELKSFNTQLTETNTNLTELNNHDNKASKISTINSLVIGKVDKLTISNLTNNESDRTGQIERGKSKDSKEQNEGSQDQQQSGITDFLSSNKYVLALASTLTTVPGLVTVYKGLKSTLDKFKLGISPKNFKLNNIYSSQGLLGSGYKLPGLSGSYGLGESLLKFGSLSAGISLAIHDGFKGVSKSQEWLGKKKGNTFLGKANSFTSAVIGGTDSGWSGAFKGLGKGALIGGYFGPVGAAIGGAIGAGLGAIGGERIAKWVGGVKSDQKQKDIKSELNTKRNTNKDLVTSAKIAITAQEISTTDQGNTTVLSGNKGNSNPAQKSLKQGSSDAASGDKQPTLLEVLQEIASDVKRIANKVISIGQPKELITSEVATKQGVGDISTNKKDENNKKDQKSQNKQSSIWSNLYNWLASPPKWLQSFFNADALAGLLAGKTISQAVLGEGKGLFSVIKKAPKLLGNMFKTNKFIPNSYQGVLGYKLPKLPGSFGLDEVAVRAGASVAGLGLAVVDGIKGITKSKEWLGKEKGHTLIGKANSFTGAALGGTDSGWSGAFKGAGKGALIGSYFGPIGTAVGAGVGGILGAIGGERITKGLQATGDFIGNRFKKVGNWFGEKVFEFGQNDDMNPVKPKVLRGRGVIINQDKEIRSIPRHPRSQYLRNQRITTDFQGISFNQTTTNDMIANNSNIKEGNTLKQQEVKQVFNLNISGDTADPYAIEQAIKNGFAKLIAEDAAAVIST